MKKTAVLLIIASVFAFTGCSGVKPAERSDESQAGTGESDVTILDSSKYWSEEELADNGEFLYQGFSLDAVNIDGTDYRRLTSEEYGITILEEICKTEDGIVVTGSGDIIISNGETQTEARLGCDIGRLHNKYSSDDYETSVLCADVTGDGKEELVIYIPYRDMMLRSDLLSVYDMETLENIPIEDTDVMDAYISEQIEKVDNFQHTDGTLYFTVTYEDGRTQDCSTKYTLDFDIEDIGYSVPSRFNGYQVSEGKLYRFAGLELYDETNYPETVKTGYVMCRIPLKYDTQSNMFVADGQVEVI